MSTKTADIEDLPSFNRNTFDSEEIIQLDSFNNDTSTSRQDKHNDKDSTSTPIAYNNNRNETADKNIKRFDSATFEIVTSQ